METRQAALPLEQPLLLLSLVVPVLVETALLLLTVSTVVRLPIALGARAGASLEATLDHLARQLVQ